MAHPERVCRICGEAGERMASLVCLAPRNLRQRFRWRRLGVDPLAPTQARSMGISNEAAKSGHTTALLGRDPTVVSPGAIFDQNSVVRASNDVSIPARARFVGRRAE